MDAYEAERTELLKAFAKRLRALRKRRYSNQEHLAEAANLHRTHVGFLEQGRREPSLSTLLILAQTLGITVDELAQELPVPKERRPAKERRERGPAKGPRRRR